MEIFLRLMGFEFLAYLELLVGDLAGALAGPAAEEDGHDLSPSIVDSQNSFLIQLS
jgi:hypothetical protein